MRLKIAKLLFRWAWKLSKPYAGGGFVVSPQGKWQPIKL